MGAPPISLIGDQLVAALAERAGGDGPGNDDGPGPDGYGPGDDGPNGSGGSSPEQARPYAPRHAAETTSEPIA
jgi:hypothetical protein